MSLGLSRRRRSQNIDTQIFLTIVLLLIIWATPLFIERYISAARFSLETILLFYSAPILLLLLYLITAPIDLLILSIPSLAYSLYIFVLFTRKVFSGNLFTLTDQILTIVFIASAILPIVIRYKRIIRKTNFYKDLYSLKSFLRPDLGDLSDLLISEGILLLLVALLEFLSRSLFSVRGYFASIYYLSGVVFSGVIISRSRDNKLYTLLSLLSWASIPLVYVFHDKEYTSSRAGLGYIYREQEIIPVERVVVGERSRLFMDLSTNRSPHILIVGSTGSGKTQLSKRLCESLSKRGVRVIVLDPHNEYKDLGLERYSIREIADIIIREIADSRESIEEFIDILRTTFRLGYLQVAVLSDTLYEYFQENRGLRDLLNYIEKKISETDNSEIQRALRNTQYYIKLLLDHISINENTVSEKTLDLNRSVAIDLSEIYKNRYVTEIYVYFLIRYIWRIVREKGFSERIRYYLVIDEAHNILSSKISELLSRILRESRKFGLGLILVTQIIDQRIREFMSNIGVVFLMKTLDRDTLDFLEILVSIDPEKALSLRETEFIYIDLYREKTIFRGRLEW